MLEDLIVQLESAYTMSIQSVRSLGDELSVTIRQIDNLLSSGTLPDESFSRVNLIRAKLIQLVDDLQNIGSA